MAQFDTGRVLFFVLALVPCCFPASLLVGQSSPLISETCNSELCAPRVSACLLMKACECERKGSDCPCCAECQRCLHNLWSDCCSCVSLCTSTNNSAASELSSTVGNIPTSLSELFDVYSETQKSLPVRFVARPTATRHSTGSDAIATETAQCKSAFYYNCFSKEACPRSCERLGATKYRWFHNGCCQCVGHTCTDYGETVPRCRNCYQ